MKIEDIIGTAWLSYQKKVANNLLIPENEKMMQLQLAQIFQTLAPIYEYEKNESIKVLLEVPVTIRQTICRSIDIVISHTKSDGTTIYYPIELKCFRLYTRSGSGKRGAQNIGMYDYWEDIENIENYVLLPDYQKGFQLTLTDDTYYVNTVHRGAQVAVYSTNNQRINVTGTLAANIANRHGNITLIGSYNMTNWQQHGNFYFNYQTT
jgi:hypothetical protein